MNLKIFFISILIFTFSYSNNVVTLKTRDGVNQRILINESISEEKVIAILFSGGKGKLKLHKDESKWTLTNFLIRSRNLFNVNGITTIAVDSPSNLKNGMENGFRTSNEHIEDISYIVKYVKEKYPTNPIWLIGTSRGTVSAAFNALNQKDIHGLVLSSSLVKNSKGTYAVTELELLKLNIPTLIVTHENDGCYVTPPSGAKEIFDLLENVKIKEVKYFSGGYEKGKLCKSQSHHGFLGIEEDVVNYISNWIKTH